MIAGGKDVLELVAILGARNVKLYHACQLKDFESYLSLGGVPSRSLMEKHRMPFTKFDTDNEDCRNWVWDKVFVNLQDFGGTFQRSLNSGKVNSVPNPFGPILLVLRPKALEQAEDVAVSLSSAGGKGFDRKEDSLDLADIDRLFLEPAGHRIKYRSGLSEEFGVREEYISAPEVSCTISRREACARLP